MTESRRSRRAWSDPMTDEPPHLAEHMCRLPRGVRLGLVGLVAAVFLIAVAVGLMATFVYQQQQYIEGRGEFRDREAARIEAENVERTRQAQCDLLDTFPADVPSLERARSKYQCGPGIPVELLTPEEQRRLGGSPAPSSPVPLVPVPPLGSPATPGVTREAPNTPSPGNGLPPEPSPAPDPLVDLGPITDPPCDALGVCL